MIELQVLGFDWDDGNIEKCQKHGLSIPIIEQFFKQDSILVRPDIKHSVAEERFIAVGKSIKGRYMFVGFTLRTGSENQTLIRPITARYMHDREVKKFEQGNS